VRLVVFEASMGVKPELALDIVAVMTGGSCSSGLSRIVCKLGEIDCALISGRKLAALSLQHLSTMMHDC
jgi:hypothetical protein